MKIGVNFAACLGVGVLLSSCAPRVSLRSMPDPLRKSSIESKVMAVGTLPNPSVDDARFADSFAGELRKRGIKVRIVPVDELRDEEIAFVFLKDNEREKASLAMPIVNVREGSDDAGGPFRDSSDVSTTYFPFWPSRKVLEIRAWLYTGKAIRELRGTGETNEAPMWEGRLETNKDTYERRVTQCALALARYFGREFHGKVRLYRRHNE